MRFAHETSTACSESSQAESIGGMGVSFPLPRLTRQYAVVPEHVDPPRGLSKEQIAQQRKAVLMAAFNLANFDTEDDSIMML